MSERNFDVGRKEFKVEIKVHGTMEQVFPLLCPEREHDYIPHWNADILWSKSGYAEEGAVFKTGDEVWIITNHEINKNISFVRYNPDVVTKLNIDVVENDGVVKSVWTQSHVSTSTEGVSKVNEMKQEEYSKMIDSLRIMMQYYLLKGKMITQEILEQHVGKRSHGH